MGRVRRVLFEKPGVARAVNRIVSHAGARNEHPHLARSPSSAAGCTSTPCRREPHRMQTRRNRGRHTSRPLRARRDRDTRSAIARLGKHRAERAPSGRAAGQR
ncbi:conserved hypothetical protein [Burkholderia pseudomallei 1106b]|uniref:Uncharacterized protein n=2 Tax=Burkholderia pseudomallei TaxID=28450 RepID=A3NZ86_BURP0|nr:conserved hypothetical protein [Burkholderia pseudomallei 1106a]AFR17315.1 hypothetical protein BPC006_I3470 [Burkholderia pseudomallei BPC006]EES26109.1 conserved hypothetical protein [Burkholderia pseudomallei 1106b]VUD53132.1 unnamed protein product [Burkholderia pseudomallei]VUD53952.1 unnamed protein product [Burkholderia pseudomallei]